MNHIYIGIALSEKEFFHLFIKELNKYVIDSMTEELQNEENENIKKILNEFNIKLKNNTLLDNLNIYLNNTELNFRIQEYLVESFINMSLCDLKYCGKKFNIYYFEKCSNELHFFIGYTHYINGLTNHIMISDLNNLNDKNIIEFLSKHVESIKLHTNNISKNIVNIINKYLIVDISKKKIEVVLSKHNF